MEFDVVMVSSARNVFRDSIQAEPNEESILSALLLHFNADFNDNPDDKFSLDVLGTTYAGAAKDEVIFAGICVSVTRESDQHRVVYNATMNAVK